MSQKDTVDVKNVQHEDAMRQNPATRLARQMLGEAVVQRVEAARAHVREQFHTRVAEAQERMGGIEKKAQDMVHTAQSTMQQTVAVARDKVLEERGEAVQKLEALVGNIGARVGLKADVESWLRLPADVREDLLVALGVASQKQVASLHEDVAALRAEITAQFVAQTEVLARIVAEHAPAQAEAAPVAPKGRTKKATPAEA